MYSLTIPKSGYTDMGRAIRQMASTDIIKGSWWRGKSTKNTDKPSSTKQVVSAPCAIRLNIKADTLRTSTVRFLCTYLMYNVQRISRKRSGI